MYNSRKFFILPSVQQPSPVASGEPGSYVVVNAIEVSSRAHDSKGERRAKVLLHRIQKKISSSREISVRSRLQR